MIVFYFRFNSLTLLKWSISGYQLPTIISTCFVYGQFYMVFSYFLDTNDDKDETEAKYNFIKENFQLIMYSIEFTSL